MVPERAGLAVAVAETLRGEPAGQFKLGDGFVVPGILHQVESEISQSFDLKERILSIESASVGRAIAVFSRGEIVLQAMQVTSAKSDLGQEK